MQGVSSLLEMFQRYFETDIVLPILIAALPWLIKDLAKKQKVFLSGMLFFLVILFNGITFWVMEKIGEGETYYRLFWIIPFGCIFAALAIKVWDKLHTGWQKAAFALVACVAVFMYGDVQLDEWKPRDLYYLPEETMAIADMIREDSDGKVLVRLYDYSRAIYGIREYNANLVLVDDGVEMAFDDIFENNSGNVTGRLIDAVIVNNQIEYVYIEKEKEAAQMALMGGGASFVGETNEHRVYRFDVEDVTQVCNVVVSNDTPTEVWGIEYATISGINETVRFIYGVDGRVQIVDETFEGTDTYFDDEKEYQTAAFEGFTLCAIDNTDGVVSADTVARFKELTEQGEPIVLLLSNPIPDGRMELPETTDKNMLQLQEIILAENSPISAIYARGYEQSYRAMLANGVMQCVCIPTINGGSVIVTIKGE